MHPITNILTVDDKDYEKALKTFQEYCNLQRFKERVLSEVPLKRAKWVKEMPRATIFREMPSDKRYPRDVCKRAEQALFTQVV